MLKTITQNISDNCLTDFCHFQALCLDEVSLRTTPTPLTGSPSSLYILDPSCQVLHIFHLWRPPLSCKIPFTHISGPWSARPDSKAEDFDPFVCLTVTDISLWHFGWFQLIHNYGVGSNNNNNSLIMSGRHPLLPLHWLLWWKYQEEGECLYITRQRTTVRNSVLA